MRWKIPSIILNVLPLDIDQQKSHDKITEYSRYLDWEAASSLRLFFQSCQELIVFCHNTYEAGPTEARGFR